MQLVPLAVGDAMDLCPVNVVLFMTRTVEHAMMTVMMVLLILILSVNVSNSCVVYAYQVIFIFNNYA